VEAVNRTADLEWLCVEDDPAGAGRICICEPCVPVSPGTVVRHVFRALGGCGSALITLRGPGCFDSWPIPIQSPDLSADCAVIAADFGMFAHVWLLPGPCADFNCDGSVGPPDFGVFAAHWLHGCPVQ